MGLLMVVSGVAGVVACAPAEAGDTLPPHCASNTEARASLLGEVSGTDASGPSVVVIGDSYSAGYGLSAPLAAWPAELPGAVLVDGFSGSGFSRGATVCPDVTYADRVASARRASVVVVQGGLNDTDQPTAEVRAGFRRLVAGLASSAPEARLVVVGPPRAPRMAAGAVVVDELLAAEAAAAGAAYVSTIDLDLPYLDDDIHLTPEGHEAFGAYVAAALPG